MIFEVLCYDNCCTENKDKMDIFPTKKDAKRYTNVKDRCRDEYKDQE